MKCPLFLLLAAVNSPAHYAEQTLRPAIQVDIDQGGLMQFAVWW